MKIVVIDCYWERDGQVLKIYIRWWLRDSNFPGWNFNPSNRDRFHPMITKETKFHIVKAGKFTTGYLFKSAFSFHFPLWSCVKLLFHSLKRLHEKVLGITKEGSRLAVMHVIAGYNLWGAYSAVWIPVKLGRTSSWPTGIM